MRTDHSTVGRSSKIFATIRGANSASGRGAWPGPPTPVADFSQMARAFETARHGPFSTARGGSPGHMASGTGIMYIPKIFP